MYSSLEVLLVSSLDLVIRYGYWDLETRATHFVMPVKTSQKKRSHVWLRTDLVIE